MFCNIVSLFGFEKTISKGLYNNELWIVNVVELLAFDLVKDDFKFLMYENV